MSKLRKIVLAAVPFGLLTSQAHAALDFSAITSAVDASTVAAAMIAMGAIMIAPGVAKWAAKKLATFFG